MSQLKPTEVSKITSKPRKYVAVEWKNGNPPAINAQNLANSEKALCVLLGHDDEANKVYSPGVVSKIIDKINAEIEARTLDIDAILSMLAESADKYLPPVDSSKNGQILVVKDGVWSVGENQVDDDNGLPSVDASKNGQILVVKDGVWSVGENEVEDVLPPVDESKNGQILLVKDGVWSVGENEGAISILIVESVDKLTGLNSPDGTFAIIPKTTADTVATAAYALRHNNKWYLCANNSAELEDLLKRVDKLELDYITQADIIQEILDRLDNLDIDYNFIVSDSIDLLPPDAPIGTIALVPAGEGSEDSDDPVDIEVLVVDTVEDLPDSVPDGTLAVIPVTPGSGNSGSSMIHYSLKVPAARSSNTYQWIVSDNGNASLEIKNLLWATPDTLVELKSENTSIFTQNYLTLTLYTGYIKFNIETLPDKETEVYLIVYDSVYQGTLNGGS